MINKTAVLQGKEQTQVIKAWGVHRHGFAARSLSVPDFYSMRMELVSISDVATTRFG
jgi:hypothetical protein